ncbi:peroxisomal membrane protein Pex16 [Nitzschia inconspicua]|uniref:Peroxisomal membrane protein PEX16 n=1 Tax=Nitzschia inconspicua TaxID=303405 RepID=A0A9K3L8Z8_9STRA|nr:peroxisomal membrane protein Pex16 [Nitzschia inconspicua]
MEHQNHLDSYQPPTLTTKTTISSTKTFRLSQHATTGHGSIVSKLWNVYRNVVIQYRPMLELTEDVFYKILFWIPHRSNDNNKNNNNTESSDAVSVVAVVVWREIGYGLLSLHRLGMDLALLNDDNSDNEYNNNNNNNNNRLLNSYGTTVQTKHPPRIPATTARILLTVIQSILPSILAIAQSTIHPSSSSSSSSSSSQTSTGILSIVAKMEQRKANVRLVLEQIKFAIRLYLMMNYWKQQKSIQDDDDNINNWDEGTVRSSTDIIPGILVNGGLYQTHRPVQGLAYEHAQALEARQVYVGQRTGWKIGSTTSRTGKHGTQSMNNSGKRNNNRTSIIVGELLHSLRPLIWAWSEAKHPLLLLEDTSSTFPTKSSKSKLLKAWCICLCMDILSIRLLEQHQKETFNMYQNPATIQELQHRKIRLLIYALRSPVWNYSTLPLLQKLSQRLFQRIPLVGGLLETFVMDWILYYQHPFIAEEQ